MDFKGSETPVIYYIPDFDHCLHYFSLYSLFFYGKPDRSKLGPLI